MFIMVIDDKLEEVDRACEALDKVAREEKIFCCPLRIQLESIYNRGKEDFHFVVRDLAQYDEIIGVLTDLFYVPVTNPYMIKNYGESIPPGGILAAIECVHRNIPVVICTDADGTEGRGHGGLSCSWIIDGLLRESNNHRFISGTECNDYFGLNPKKDWEGAARALITMIKERRKT